MYFYDTECRYARMRDLEGKCRAAGIPRRYAVMTFEDYEETVENQRAIRMARWYSQDKPLTSLYIMGGCGTGKTFMASLISKELISRGDKVRFVDVPSLLGELKESFDRKDQSAEAILRRYAGAEVLVLDDLGAGQISAWAIGVMYRLINDRYNEERRTIITSNYDLNTLRTVLSREDAFAGGRLISRLKGMCEFAYLGMNDRRC